MNQKATTHLITGSVIDRVRFMSRGRVWCLLSKKSLKEASTGTEIIKYSFFGICFYTKINLGTV